jgi:hypothetical protein
LSYTDHRPIHRCSQGSSGRNPEPSDILPLCRSLPFGPRLTTSGRCGPYRIPGVTFRANQSPAAAYYLPTTRASVVRLGDPSGWCGADGEFLGAPRVGYESTGEIRPAKAIGRGKRPCGAGEFG